ncbi:DUF3164 family protein [Epilithonimonas xixisoli]|uniref:DUF3164 family protein n=1 Tax=Epilithonimonas xixisoli TaxID=1476462 RepID=A0A4R8II47_9FLAO|nr:hypothetical protein [Epilithonimonas xixisoli]TDX86209.1 hypothetical protein B0I22_0319 [Epilithonimonas xixisoli]
MTTISIAELSPEQKKALAQQLKDEEKLEKEKIANDKKILKGLKNDFVLANVDFFIDKRNDVEDRIVKMFQDLQSVIELDSALYGDKKAEQDSYSHTLEDGSAYMQVGWNVSPTFNGTESHGINQLKEFMSSLAGNTENEKLLMKFLNIALKTDSKGDYNPKAVRALDALRAEANSDVFSSAMDIINEAMIDIRTSRYVRGYKLVDFGDNIVKRVNFKFSID